MKKLKIIFQILTSDFYVVATAKEIRGKMKFEMKMFEPDGLRVCEKIIDEFEADEHVQQAKQMLSENK